MQLLDGKVIDGRRRLRACEMAGVTPHFREISTADPIAFVIEKQNRRDLTTGQRAQAVVRATELRKKLDAEAKGHQKRKSLASVPANLPEQKTGDTRDQLGKLVGVTGRTIQDAVKVIEKDGWL